MELLETIFKFVGGIGLFLYGMNIMADGLQKSAGDKMKKLLAILTNNKLMAVISGALITTLIQSSSATTVMVVGFVNAGIINLTQAVGVIMGANIGTTITAWIVSMNEWGSVLKPEFFAPVVVGIGAFFVIFTKNKKKKEVGEILLGFGVLFIGLTYMSGAISPYKDSQIFKDAFGILGQNPVLGILTGAVVTAIIQSSSASVSILQALAMNGIVNWNSAIFITLGQNIGTCVTALISSAGTQKLAKRAAVIHLLFNVFGAIIFGIIMFVLFKINTEWAKSSIDSIGISIFHTAFNILNTIILFPFANQLVKLSGLIVKNSEVQETEIDPVKEVKRKLDLRILETPSFAIETAVDEVVCMGNIALTNAKNSIKALISNDKELINKVYTTEKSINELEKILTEYLVQVDNLSLNEAQHTLIKNLFYTVSDIERVGDHSENIVELAETKIKDHLEFSETAILELEEIASTAISALETAIKAREDNDLILSKKVEFIEESVDDLEDSLREKHISRLSNRECVPESGVIFLDVISNIERISDHAYNISGYIESENVISSKKNKK